jgi:hypothetical protein
MLYDIWWMHYFLGVGIFWALGFLGVIIATSISKKSSRTEALIFSLCIFIAGIYLIYQWDAEKSRIRELAEQMERALPSAPKNPQTAGLP